MATHIICYNADREDGGHLLLPIEGTVFSLAQDYTTVARTASGQFFRLDESITDIEATISAVTVVRAD